MVMRILWTVVATAGLATVQQGNPLTDQVMARYKQIKLSLLDSAEVMPEQHYGFRLTPGQRTYGEWIAHAAVGNYGYCAAIRGVKTPQTGPILAMTGKAELSKALLESFQYCDEALVGMTDAKAMKGIAIGERTVYPVTGMVNLAASQNEHYGNIVGYLRSKGIVPPSTVRAKQGKGNK